MLLVRDVLDTKIRDTYRREVGRVDGIGLEVGPGAQPRVAWLESGGPVAWRRLHPRLGRWAEAVRRRLGPRQVEPARYPWAAVARTASELHVRVDADRTPAIAWELWLRERVVRRIPFSGRSEG